MNLKTITRIIGGLVLLIGLVGLLLGEKQLGNVLNIDILMDIIRIALGGYLLYSSSQNQASMRHALGVFGVVYLANFVIALISPSMFGLLPHHYGPMDNLLNSVGGIIGVALAFPWTHTEGHARA